MCPPLLCNQKEIDPALLCNEDETDLDNPDNVDHIILKPHAFLYTECNNDENIRNTSFTSNRGGAMQRSRSRSPTTSPLGDLAHSDSLYTLNSSASDRSLYDLENSSNNVYNREGARQHSRSRSSSTSSLSECSDSDSSMTPNSSARERSQDDFVNSSHNIYNQEGARQRSQSLSSSTSSLSDCSDSDKSTTPNSSVREKSLDDFVNSSDNLYDQEGARQRSLSGSSSTSSFSDCSDSDSSMTPKSSATKRSLDDVTDSLNSICNPKRARQHSRSRSPKMSLFHNQSVSDSSMTSNSSVIDRSLDDFPDNSNGICNRIEAMQGSRLRSPRASSFRDRSVSDISTNSNSSLSRRSLDDFTEISKIICNGKGVRHRSRSRSPIISSFRDRSVSDCSMTSNTSASERSLNDFVASPARDQMLTTDRSHAMPKNTTEPVPRIGFLDGREVPVPGAPESLTIHHYLEPSQLLYREIEELMHEQYYSMPN